MNIFCRRRTLSNPALSSMLGVSCGQIPQFGFRLSIPLKTGKNGPHRDRHETRRSPGRSEAHGDGLSNGAARVIERYRDLGEVFDPGELMMSGDVVPGYQLIRGVLAAFATGGSFCVLCDARRPDLIEKWYSIMRAVRSCVLRCRLQLLTWQELTAVLPMSLQKFLAAKYGITP